MIVKDGNWLRMSIERMRELFLGSYSDKEWESLKRITLEVAELVKTVTGGNSEDVARLMTRMIFHPSEVQYICQKVDASVYNVALLHANVNSQNSQQRQ